MDIKNHLKMKKLLSFLFFAFMASIVAMAQEDVCSVVNTILKETDSLIVECKDADALALLRAAQVQPELRTCSEYSRLAEEIERIETKQYLVIPVNDRIRITMVKVKGGTFQMGATSEQGRDVVSDVKPAHRVTLSDYYIGQTEVTQALWQAVMGSNPSNWKGSNLPVEQVSWNDCQQFITKLNQITGRRFRLPTEAEWEYAARGGNMSRGYKYAGSNDISSVAWYWANSGDSRLSGDFAWDRVSANHCRTHPVGQKQANELGIYDMSGNVYEWCQDWYDDKYYSKSPSTNPCNNTSASFRVDRGGGWNYDAGVCRVSYRCGNTPDGISSSIGLRLAM